MTTATSTAPEPDNAADTGDGGPAWARGLLGWGFCLSPYLGAAYTQCRWHAGTSRTGDAAYSLTHYSLMPRFAGRGHLPGVSDPPRPLQT